MEMTKASRSFVATGTLLFLFATRAAFAQESNVRATFFGSGSFLKAERNFTVDGDPKRSNFADGGKIGVRVTVDLDSHWAVEGAYGYGTNNLRILDIGTPTITRAFGTRIHQFTGNLSYYFSEPHHGLRPFVTAGAGLVRFNPTGNAKSEASIEFVNDPATIMSNTKFEFNYGAGLEVAASDHLGFRFDLRDHLAGVPRFGVPEAPAAGVADFFPVSGVTHGVEVSGGIVFYFGH
jgi:opacity protein-like surface antigen